MSRTIMITGSTDGIGLHAARTFAELGHRVVLHGRGQDKLEAAKYDVETVQPGAVAAALNADLSDLHHVLQLADQVCELGVDILINNAGVLKTPAVERADGLDIRFVVNTLAPYVLTKKVLPTLSADSRVINLSSAAQSPVSLEAMAGREQLGEMPAYAQSKLALTMWTNHLSDQLNDAGPVVLSVNPGSLLGTKMVKEGFGTPGKDISIGVEALRKTALDEEFVTLSGCYFDQDAGRVNDPHPDALDKTKNAALVDAMDKLLANHGVNLA